MHQNYFKCLIESPCLKWKPVTMEIFPSPMLFHLRQVWLYFHFHPKQKLYDFLYSFVVYPFPFPLFLQYTFKFWGAPFLKRYYLVIIGQLLTNDRQRIGIPKGNSLGIPRDSQYIQNEAVLRGQSVKYEVSEACGNRI